jgi:hypothetical protein
VRSSRVYGSIVVQALVSTLPAAIRISIDFERFMT